MGCLNVPSHIPKLYRRNSVCICAILTWNDLQNLHINILFHKLTTKCLKKLLSLHGGAKEGCGNEDFYIDFQFGPTLEQKVNY